MRTTIHDIAKASGLSPSTVSRVLTNNPHVSAEAKRKVEEAISQTGYVPNGLARGLVTRRRNLIAVIVPDASNPFYIDILSAINEVAAQNDMSAILVTQNENDRRTTVEKVLEMGIDGFIHLGAVENDSTIPMLAQTETPFVLLDRLLPGVQADKVLFDNHHSGFAATEYMLSLGHRRIAYVYGAPSSFSSWDKYQGYVDALREHCIPMDSKLVVSGMLTFDSSYRAMQNLLDERESLGFTAVICGSDYMALGARQAILERGLRIPEDLSILGMDDIFYTQLAGVDLTTIRVPRSESGRLAAKLLIKRIANPNKEQEIHILETELICRASCCPLKGEENI